MYELSITIARISTNFLLLKLVRNTYLRPYYSSPDAAPAVFPFFRELPPSMHPLSLVYSTSAWRSGEKMKLVILNTDDNILIKR
jgi:hypothetical protein